MSCVLSLKSTSWDKNLQTRPSVCSVCRHDAASLHRPQTNRFLPTCRLQAAAFKTHIYSWDSLANFSLQTFSFTYEEKSVSSSLLSSSHVLVLYSHVKMCEDFFHRLIVSKRRMDNFSSVLESKLRRQRLIWCLQTKTTKFKRENCHTNIFILIIKKVKNKESELLASPT